MFVLKNQEKNVDNGITCIIGVWCQNYFFKFNWIDPGKIIYR